MRLQGNSKVMGLVVGLIYVSFALDSLLKIDLGFRLHLGVLMMVAMTVLAIPSFFSLKKSSLERDLGFYLFLIYCLLSAFLLQAAGAAVLSVYVLFALVTMAFIAAYKSYFRYYHFYWFQIVLIASGLFQYGLFLLFDYQVAFIDPEHYEKGYSVSKRLRGFFLEPNWYAIALAFNSLLLVLHPRGLQGRGVLCFFTLLVFLLNGSIGPAAVFMGLVTIWLMIERPVIGVGAGVFLVVGVCALVLYRGALVETQSLLGFVNSGSRVTPLINSFAYLNEQSIFTIVFGNGFGSWGIEAVGRGISTLVKEPSEAARDASELPVLLFELGFLGLFLIVCDFWVVVALSKHKKVIYSGVMFLFLFLLVFYPILKFFFYMPYFFLLRHLSNERSLFDQVYGNRRAKSNHMH